MENENLKFQPSEEKVILRNFMMSPQEIKSLRNFCSLVRSLLSSYNNLDYIVHFIPKSLNLDLGFSSKTQNRICYNFYQF